MVEFSSHGGHAVPEALLGALVQVGAREALPGEFTRRAVLNGKLDLVQAEAVGDLIDATSDSMRRLVLHQLDGGLSKQIDMLRDRLLHIEALLAYDIDFPEEDNGPISRSGIAEAAQSALMMLDVLLSTAPATELVRDGAIVVIAGRPNVGKSSLFNALLGETRAIVTEIPGTTRDAIEARVEFGDWPVRIVDTAGLRLTDEVVERLGIEASERYIRGAHVVIACDEDLAALQELVAKISKQSPSPIVPVLTKVDRRLEPDAIIVPESDNRTTHVVRVSAHARTGLTTLALRVRDVLVERYGTIPVTRPALTRKRQRTAVEQARNELAAFQHEWDRELLPASIAAVHIRAGVAALDELIGAVDVDDVLARVFETFCVGK